MGSEKFCLRWNDFESNISVAFRELRDDADFFDITLACEDKQVQAHKVILSACSPWFRGVLKKNPHQHPLLYLKGVRHSDLISVLNFMYHGEVNVSQDELNSFLAVAEELSVKGLTQNDNEKPKPTVKNEPSDLGKRPSSHSSSIPPVKKPRVSAPPSTSGDNSKQSFDEDDIQEIMPVKAEPAGAASLTVTPDVPAGAGQTFDPNQSGIDASFGDESYDYEQYDEGAADDYGEGGQYDPNAMAGTSGGADGNKATGRTLDEIQRQFIGQMVQQSQGRFRCSVCSFSAVEYERLEHHVIIEHPDQITVFHCQYCEKPHRTKGSLIKHISRYHKLEHKTAKMQGAFSRF